MDNNKLHVDVRGVKDQIVSAKIEETRTQINTTFTQISNFETSWCDANNNNSARFQSIISSYQKRMASIVDEINQLKEEILAIIDEYEAIERTGLDW